jgi:hypothetical protein
MWTLISWGFKHSRFDFVGNLSCAIITHKYGDINTTGSDIIPLLPTSKGGSEIPPAASGSYFLYHAVKPTVCHP